MSGRKSKDKGYRMEAATVLAFKACGIDARRMPLSGALPDPELKGDVVAEIAGRPRRFECKSRASGFTRIREWLKDNYAVIAKTDRQEAFVVIRFADFLQLVEAAEQQNKRAA